MKELSIEQKAKAYDNLIERLKDFQFEYRFSAFSDTIEKYFPELKESKDDKMKRIISDILLIDSDEIREILDTNNVLIQDIDAWLEKQGEQKLTPKFKVGDKIWHKNYKGECMHHIIRIENNNYIGDDNTSISISTADKEYELVEKPVDKVKPKFKVGDWIITNKKHLWYVDETPETTSYLYRLINQYGKVEVAEFEVVDKKAKLWTIQDANDGDVLFCESGWTCIFKALDNHNNTFSSYCFMDKDEWFCDTGSECHTLKEEFIKAYNGKIYPATKEQRDVLMKAMTNTGYFFDFEKKELKKI